MARRLFAVLLTRLYCSTLVSGSAFLLMLGFVQTGFAQTPPQGCPPVPASGQTVLLDLGGNVNGVCPSLPTTSPQPIPGGGNGTYQQYTVNFTATASNVVLTFAFRDDEQNISFTNVSVTDLSNPGGTLLTNGNFSGGIAASGGNVSAPANWAYSNVNAQNYEGVVASSSSDCYTSSNCWYDGSLEGYDTISQTITTNSGDNYQVSFYVAEDSYCAGNGGGSSCNFSDVSTNGNSGTAGNGIDVLVYATGATVPASQTLTLTMLDSGAGSVTDNLGVLGTCSESAGVVSQNGVQSSGATCTATYPLGTVVELTATASSSSTFGATASQSASGVAIPGWGGACTSSEKNPDQCDLTMDSAQNVTATFVAPGQSGTQPVTTTQAADYGFNGGVNNLNSGGNDLNVQLTSGSSTTVSVTQIPMSQAACDSILALAFPSAYCFVYQLGATPSEADSAQMYELTCPGSATGGTCGSITAATFFATLGADFIFSTSTQGTTENPGLTTSGSSSNVPPNSVLMFDGGNPYVGVAKFAGTDTQHPCSLPANPTSESFTEPLTNQIASFTFVNDTPTASPTKSKSGGTGSCWIVTYNMPNEAPTVSITGGPSNGQGVGQNSQLTASFTCNAANAGDSSAVGPYLTVSSCTLTDSYTGSGSPQSYSAATGTASTSDGPVSLDTSTPGPHTVTATVVDSATDTISASPVTYNVQGGTTTTVSSSSISSTYGQMVTFTATVTGGSGQAPTGAVTWSISGSAVCSSTTPLSGTGNLATATCSSTLGPVGGSPYAVTASYSGDNYNGPSSGMLSPGQTVGQATSSVTLNCPSVTYTGSALTPCTATYSTSDGLSGTVTVSYSNNTNVGTASASATYAGDSNHQGSSSSSSFSIMPATATVVLSNMTQTYTGSALSPTVTTTPSGLSYSLTGAPDTGAGSYSVTATINSGQNYTGSATGTFVIKAATPTVTVADGGGVYTGSQYPGTAAVTVVSGGSADTGTVTYSYVGTGTTSYGPSATAPTNVGTYSVTVAVAASGNYGTASSSTVAFSITPGTATVTLGNLSQTYTGSPLSPTVTTSPSGLSYTLTGAPDTNAGSYTVTATINSGQNYTGSASGTFVISAPVWTITPSTYSFGTLSIGQSASQSFTVTNPTTTSTPIKVSIPVSGSEGGSTPNEVDPDDYVITSCNCQGSLGAGKSCTFTVTWTPDSDDLPLYATGGSLAYLQVTNNSKTVLAYATMTGKALDPTASLSATSYSFGSETTGSSVTEEVATLTNSGPTPLILGTTSINGSSAFKLASSSGSCSNGESIPSGSSCTIYVTFKPTSTSSVGGTVTINGNATNAPLTIALSGK
jgi:hypothetical protein